MWLAFRATIVLSILSGCAADVVRHPVQLSPAPGAAALRYVSTQPVSLYLDSGYERLIRPGTEFAEVGRIRQGRVLKPTSTTFTIEGAHIHEAYPVLEGARIVGFFLPAEQAFSPLSQPASLLLEERKP